MKFHLSLTTFLILLFSCSGIEKSNITFAGKIKNNTESIVKVSNYKSSLSEEIEIDSSGNFNGSFLIDKEGYYYFQIGRSYTTVFFSPNNKVFVDIDADSFFQKISYSGTLQKENNYNVSKSKLRSKLVGDAKEYFVVPLDEFLSKIDNTKRQLLQLLESNTQLNEKTKAIERKIIHYEYLQAYNNYQKFYSYHKKVNADLPADYYEPVINMDLNDDEMFRYSRAYRNLVVENFRLSSKKALAENQQIDIIDFVEGQIKKMNSQDIKEQFTSMLIRQMKQSNSNIDRDYIRIDSLLTTKRMKDKLLLRYRSAKENTSGAVAVDFNYENFEGGRTSLKDLSGKIVYIDVWATWCGPCIKEMPALKKLVDYYKGKDIEFVSISIDSEKDYEKWRKMVPEKDVGGIQLYDSEGLNSSFMKSFSVSLIPRFMMIDRDGKIITANAPRPSSENIKAFIDSHLNDNKPKVVKFKTL